MIKMFREILKIVTHNRVKFFTLILFMSFFYSQTPTFAVTGAGLSKCYVDPEKKIDCSSNRSRSTSLSCLQQNSQEKCGINLVPVVGLSQKNNLTEDSCWRPNGTKGNKKPRFHYGIDIGTQEGMAVKRGKPVVAAADGYEVRATPSCTASEGNMIKIFHALKDDMLNKKEGPIVAGEGAKCYCTVYMHLHSFTTKSRSDKPGQVAIKAGEQIGYVGGTGNSRGATRQGDTCSAFGWDAHLHFEIRSCINGCGAGTSINPLCDDLCGEDNKGDKNFKVTECRDCKNNPAACQTTSSVSGFQPNDTQQVQNFENAQVDGISQSESQAGGESPARCSIENYRSSFKDCLFCKLFENIFNTASLISGHAFKILAPSVLLLVLIGTAIWISFSLLKQLSAFEVKDPRRMLKEIINKLFIVFIVVVLLKTDPYVIFSLTIEPVFNTGAKLAQLIGGSTYCATGDFNIVGTGLAKGTTGGGLPQSMGLSILCTIKSIQNQILDVMSLGSTLLCIGFFEKSWKNIPLFPHLGFAISGLILWIGAFLLMVIYPWLLIDTVLKLAVVIALLPAAIGGFAFKATKKYVGIIWNSFMNTVFTFIFLTIIIFIITTMISNIVQDTIKAVNDISTTSSFDKLLDTFSIWRPEFLELAFVLILGWAVLSEGSALADKFSSSVKFSQNIGSNVGTTMMSGAKGVASPVAKGAMSVAKFTGENAWAGAKALKNRLSINRQAKGIEKKAGTNVDANGNATYSYKNWRGKNITKTLTKDAYGNQKIVSTKTSKNKTIVTQQDKFMTTKTVTDKKTGEVIGEKTQMNAAFMKSLLNADGRLNQVAVNSFLQNSMHDQEKLMIGLMNQINKERFGDNAKMSDTFTARKMEIGKNEKGQTTFSVQQTLDNGSKQVFNMTLSETRVKSSLETISKKGKSFTMESDGIINKTRKRRYDKDGEIIKKYEDNKYSIASYYDKIHGRGLNSLGDFADYIPKDEIMHDEEEIARFTHQIKTYGDPQADGSFLR